MFRDRTRLWLALVAGAAVGGASFFLERLSDLSDFQLFARIQQAVIIMIFPGMFGAMAFSGNVHAFLTPVVAVGNFVFWFTVIYFASRVVSKLAAGRASRSKE